MFECTISQIKKEKRKAQLSGEILRRADCCHALGLHYFNSNKFSQSLEEFEEELILRTSLKDQLSLGLTTKFLGDCCLELGNINVAVEHHEQSLRIFDSLGNDNLEELVRSCVSYGRSLLCLAESQDFLERFQDTNRALVIFKRALQLVEEPLRLNPINSELITSKICAEINIGILYELLLSFDEAITTWNEAIKLSKTANKPEYECRCYLLLGNLFARRNNRQVAEVQNSQAVSISPKLSSKLLCEVYQQKAMLQAEERNFEMAVSTLSRLMALKVKDQLLKDSKSMLKSFRSILSSLKTMDENHAGVNRIEKFEYLGDTCSKIGCLSSAKHYYDQMKNEAKLQGDQKKLNDACFSLGKTCFDMSDFTEAIKYYEMCDWDCGDDNAGLHVEVGDCHAAMTKFDSALRLYKEGFSFAESQRARKLLAEKMVKVSRRWGNEVETENAEGLLTSLLDQQDSDNESTEEVDLGDELSEESEGSKFVSRKRPAKRKKNEKGETPLHLACIDGNLKKVISILRQDIDAVNQRDNCGWTPLHEAANRGHSEIVRLLVENGGRVNDKGGLYCEGVTPLNAAATCGHAETVEVLLELNADVNIADDNGNRAYESYRQWLGRTGIPLSDDISRTLAILTPSEDPPARMVFPDRVTPTLRRNRVKRTAGESHVETYRRTMRDVKRPRTVLGDGSPIIKVNVPSMIDEHMYNDRNWIVDDSDCEDLFPDHIASSLKNIDRERSPKILYHVLNIFYDEYNFKLTFKSPPSLDELCVSLGGRLQSVLGLAIPSRSLNLSPNRAVYSVIEESIFCSIDFSQLDLGDLYESACQGLARGSLNHVKESFKSMERSNCLSLFMGLLPSSALPPICGVLRFLKGLKRLDLSGNLIDDGTLMDVILPAVRGVSDLDLSSNELRSLSGFVGIKFPNLNRLSLGYNFFSNSVSIPRSLAALLRSVRSLRFLDLNTCSLPENLLDHLELAEALRDSVLEHVDLSSNGLRLTADCMRLGNIRDLDLSVSELPKCLKSMFIPRSLRRLFLRDCALTDESFSQLYEQLGEIRLLELDLSHNKDLHVESLLVCVMVPKAESVTVVDCGIRSPLGSQLFNSLNVPPHSPVNSLRFSCAGLLPSEGDRLRCLDVYTGDINGELITLNMLDDII